MANILDHALTYISYGWAVFPVNGKIPATKNGFKDATKDPATKLFTKPSSGIAIATGAISGIFVLDIDNKHGVMGSESLIELERNFGKLPNTVESLTPSGGRHLYFKYIDGIGCRTGLRKGIDVRGDGGYVVAPPSIIDGKSYEWELSSLPGECPIAEAPKWLIDLLIKPTETRGVNDIVTQGYRNDHLMKVAVSLRKQGVSPDQLETVLQSINTAKCNPPLDPKEVRTIAQSVGRYDSDVKEAVHYTDTWNANLFVKMHGETIRYCNALGGWLIWDGTRWLRDESFQIMRLAKETVREMHRLANIQGEKKFFDHAIKSESEARLNAMVSLARYLEGVTLPQDSFDSDEYLLNCLNGTLNLNTGLLQDPNPYNHITKLCPVIYDPHAKSELWARFLYDVLGDDELITFVQKAIGYSLCGSTKEHALFMLYGTGRNGKSTFLKAIHNMLGDYAKNTQASMLIESRRDGPQNDIARLRGARFVMTAETDANKHLAEAQIKQLTGGDPITARFLYKELFQFIPTFKIFFATNHKPTISGMDVGIWRRMIPIPFEREIPDSKVDTELDAKLKTQYPAILAWAVEGYKLWRSEGLGRVKKIFDFTAEYKTDSDNIRNFLEECCEFGDYEVTAGAIQQALSTWCRNNAVRRINRTEFNEWMKVNGFEKCISATPGIKGYTVFKKIKLKQSTTPVLQQVENWI